MRTSSLMRRIYYRLIYWRRCITQRIEDRRHSQERDISLNKAWRQLQRPPQPLITITLALLALNQTLLLLVRRRLRRVVVVLHRKSLTQRTRRM